ncbi:MAG TPA: hypothetical protein VLD18_01900, partial [Verrucomicrobiae bacterium]|nr:hypothetical protein [Verrucomicrobiae bacterium]
VSKPGYEPLVVGPLNMSTNGLVVRLSKGGGPGGVVLLPEGGPAAGATVIYAASREQFALNEDGNLLNYGNETAVRVTDATGAFRFPQRLDGLRLVAAHPAGWLVVEQRELNPRLKLQLEPWAVIAGVLVTTKGVPVPNEELVLGFDADGVGKGLAAFGLNLRTRTGAQGEFILTNVPPADLVLHRMVASGQTRTSPPSWSRTLQTRFYASPGVTNDLGKVILDTPPPEPLLRRLKQKIGL